MNAPPRKESTVEVAARLTYTGKPDTAARVELIPRPRDQRVARTLIGLGQCWGLAVVAVFLPVLHFILVPALLIAGPFVARARWLEHASARRMSGTCPGCGHTIGVALRQSARPELPFRCPDCGRPLTLRIDPSVIESAAEGRASTG
jgi:hypothetical protein